MGDDTPATDNGFSSIYDVAANPGSGGFAMADIDGNTGYGRINYVDGSGVITTLASGSGIGYVADMHVAISATGVIYASIANSAGGGKLIEINDGISNTIRNYPSPSSYPAGLAIDSSGNIYIADYGRCVVEKLSGSGAFLSNIAGTGTCGTTTSGTAASSNIPHPQDVAIGQNGSIYFVDYGVGGFYGYLQEIAPTGDLTVASQEIESLVGLASDGAGNFYVSSNSDGIARINPDATETTISEYESALACQTPSDVQGPARGDGGPVGLASFCGAEGLSINSVGDLLVADSGDGRVRSVAATDLPPQSAGAFGATAGLDNGGYCSMWVTFDAVALYSSSSPAMLTDYMTTWNMGYKCNLGLGNAIIIGSLDKAGSVNPIQTVDRTCTGSSQICNEDYVEPESMYICSGTSCAGTYSVLGSFNLQAPEGTYWDPTSPVISGGTGSSCGFSSGDEVMQCQLMTNSDVVTATE